MKNIKFYIFLIISLFIFLNTNIEGYCKNVVVVIDAGHGGDALGGNIDDRIERDINLITAQSMYNRLKLYEGVDVYMTRTNNTDKDMSREDRMKVGSKYHADLFVAVHYNMSENHNLYGTEVWAPLYGSTYVPAMEYATIVNKDLEDLGLFNRGIKHRADSSLNSEYYGIIKYGVEKNIPTVIVEHCHLDNEKDKSFWNEQSYKNFGITDADAVAKYFKLSSSALNIDYSNYQKTKIDDVSELQIQDLTPPEECSIELVSGDISGGGVEIDIHASDSDGYIQYYAISYDEGNTFGNLIPWNGQKSNEYKVQIPLLATNESQLVIRVFNQYDLTVDSNSIALPRLGSDEIEIVQDSAEEIDTNNYVEKEVTFEKNKNNENVPVIIALIILILILIFFTVILIVSIKTNNHNKRVKNKKNKK